MKRFLNFVKTTAVGGLLVILPVALILFVAGQLAFTLHSASLYIIESEHTPGYIRDNPVLVVSIGAGVLIAACFLTGLFVRTRLGQLVKQSFVDNVTKRIPILGAITTLTERFAGIEGKEFAPVEVDAHGDGIASLGFLIEHLPDERAAVFIPTAPVATVGNVMIVSPEKLTYLDASVSDTVSVISQWGLEMRKLYRKEAAPVDTAQ